MAPLDMLDWMTGLILGGGILVVLSTPFWPMIVGPRFPKHVILHVFVLSAIYFAYRGKSLAACIAFVPVVVLGFRLLREELEEDDPSPKL